MKMRAYLEKIDKEWLDDFVYISKYPLQSMGYEIVPFNGEDSDSLYRFSIDPSSDICIGSVEATTTFFNIATPYFPTIMLLALIIAHACEPTFKPRASTDSTVIVETTTSPSPKSRLT